METELLEKTASKYGVVWLPVTLGVYESENLLIDNCGQLYKLRLLIFEDGFYLVTKSEPIRQLSLN